ncbi:hypothetical protein GSI_07016 [Ganoderma sinense ZZ0214-1]|uniref:Uncharacterized protein n=1 Tax=Ganoderma sinense ZZ0214-1 TaxID=1077348 RepID=A0A2G8SB67_9APHY|nr:hypothetical protein GSI_07016 [Ganoderma sinense ZZ0214-1]
MALLPQLSCVIAAVDASVSPPISTGTRRRAVPPTLPPQAPGHLLRPIPLATQLQVPPLPPAPSLSPCRLPVLALPLRPKRTQRPAPGRPRASPSVVPRASAKAPQRRLHLPSRPRERHPARRVRGSGRAAHHHPPFGSLRACRRST